MTGDDAVQARFLSVLSHDLRGALHTVQLSLEMLRRDLNGKAPDQVQMSEDLELGQQALLDATVRLDRLVTAERLRRGMMPVRVQSTDIVPVARRAVEQATVAATAAAGDAPVLPSVAVNLPDKWLMNTDPRLVESMIGGLADHALRCAHGRRVAVSASSERRILTIAVERADWMLPVDEQLLQPAAEVSGFDPATVSLLVAGRCADLLQVDLSIQSTGGSQSVQALFSGRD